uniref:ENTH domain-containing protein n=1 Tax=Kalanchoe fedtschenkoi TaxID=63787 RepID=A0A7N0ULE9_KALFE
MKLWKRASEALKDRSSLWVSTLSRRTAYRNPEIDAAVIKATSHDEGRVDYKNVQRVFQWLSTSPAYSKPLITAISRRMERTRSWVVALKGLMLMHGVFCCNVPAIQKIGRLPFDLSDFADGHSGLSRAWCVNAFVRSYFSFLDQKSAIAGREWTREGRVMSRLNEPIAHQLVRLDELQTLLDKLLRVKPVTGELMRFNLVIEAMDCVIIEIFQIYSSICDGVARVLMRIYESGRLEAAMALRILKRSTVQGNKLREYFEFCRKYGILNAAEFPKVVEIPDEDIKELERIINGVPEKIIEMEVERKADDSKVAVLKTIVTEKWEVFDEDVKLISNNGEFVKQQCGEELSDKNMLVQKQHQQPLFAPVVLPDLITF